MPKEKPISNFHKILEDSYEDRSVLDRTYSVDKVAKLLGTSKAYAKKKIKKLENEGDALPIRGGKETRYRFSANGIVYLGLDEFGREIERLHKMVKRMK